MYDVLIRNGKLVDGTGRAPYESDIAIQGDKIQKIGKDLAERGTLEIDAKGKLVIPGLIDPHVHEEWVCFDDGLYDLFLKQGVTTLINGNCGHSLVGGPVEKVIGYYFNNGLLSYEQRDRYLKTWPKWKDFDGYAKAVEQCGTNLNFATLLGYGTIRELVMGGAYPQAPSAEEWREIERIIRSGMEQGMFGMSYGLDYIPGRYAELEELAASARLIADYDGVCAAHTRQSAGIEKAVEEFLEVARRSGAKIQISHLRATCDAAFEKIREAVEKEHIRACVDTIPRSTGHCMSKKRIRQFISAITDELFNAGEAGVVEALHTPEGRAAIHKGAFILAGTKDDIFVVNSQDASLENRCVSDIARERGTDPEECILDLIGDDNVCTFWLGGPSRADFPVEGHSAQILHNPYVCTGSDHVMGDGAVDPFDWYELQRIGAQPIFIKACLAKGVSLEETIRRNTSMVAEHFGIKDRGVLREGFYADIAVIDLDRYDYPEPDQMHYKTPDMRAEGVEYVLVNGVVTLREGEALRSCAGRVLKK